MYSTDTIMESLRCVAMLSDHIRNWCSKSLGRANENLRSLASSQSANGPCKDASTITEQAQISSSVQCKKSSQIKRKSSTNSKKPQQQQESRTKSFAESFSNRTSAMVQGSTESFAQCMDKFRKLLYKDDDSMFLQEKLEQDSMNNFFKNVDNWIKRNSKCDGACGAKCKGGGAEPNTCGAECKVTPSEIFCIPGKNSDFCWKENRQFGGGYPHKKYRCYCNCRCQNKKRKKPEQTFIEYDWTNYDWCATLKEELKRRTTQLNRMKREMKLRTIRILPDVGFFG